MYLHGMVLSLRARRRARPSAFAWRSATKRSILGARSAPSTTRPSAAIVRSIKPVVSARPAMPGAEAASISTSTSTTMASADRCLWVLFRHRCDRTYFCAIVRTCFTERKNTENWDLNSDPFLHNNVKCQIFTGCRILQDLASAILLKDSSWGI